MLAVLNASEHGRVVVIHGGDDEFAKDKLVPRLVEALGERGYLGRVEAVERSGSVRALLERHVASDVFIAAVVCASEPAGAATLIWELADPGSHALFGSRVLVMLGTMRRLSALPERLLEAFEFIGVDDVGEDQALAGLLNRVAAMDRAPRPIDVLASVYRSAIARRSPDALLAIHATLGHSHSIEVDPRELASTVRVGDRGPRPNPLWSHWISHGRTLALVEPAPSRSASTVRTKKSWNS